MPVRRQGAGPRITDLARRNAGGTSTRRRYAEEHAGGKPHSGSGSIAPRSAPPPPRATAASCAPKSSHSGAGTATAPPPKKNLFEKRAGLGTGCNGDRVQEAGTQYMEMFLLFQAISTAGDNFNEKRFFTVTHFQCKNYF